jgi:hypothetical protein
MCVATQKQPKSNGLRNVVTHESGGGQSIPPGVVGHDGKEGEGDEEADVGIGAHHLVQPLGLGLTQKPAPSARIAKTSSYSTGSVSIPPQKKKKNFQKISICCLKYRKFRHL